jgi:hypothetical protein
MSPMNLTDADKADIAELFRDTIISDRFPHSAESSGLPRTAFTSPAVS